MRSLTAFVLLNMIAAPALAEQVFNENVIVDGRLCSGSGCAAGEVFSTDELKLKSANVSLLFEDSSVTAGFPTTNWRVLTNHGGDNFIVENVDDNRTPLRIDAGAGSNTLVVADNSKIGIGTLLPQDWLHIAAGGYPSIRLEDKGSVSGFPWEWRVVASSYGFLISDETSGVSPFSIDAAAEDDMFRITDTGVGIGGLFVTAAPLHVRRNDGTALVRVEEVSATSSPRTMLNLQNNGRPEIVMGNTAQNIEWSLGAGGSFFVKTGTVGSTSGDKTKVFTIKGNGNAILAGSLTTGGTTCGGGCDRVFTEQAIIPAADYASAMWAQGFLPHVGPTLEGAPLNVSEKLGGILNAVEHAHVFIDQQRDQIETLQSEKSALEARLSRLEGANIFIAQQQEQIAALTARLDRLEAE